MAIFKRIKFTQGAPEGVVRAPSGPRLAGHALRQRREELGLALDEVGAALRIKPAYLAALEEGQPDRLPGSAYAIGFLKSYSDYLGLDSAEVVRRFKAESAGLDTRPDLSFPMPLGERSVPGGGMLLVALILVGCGYGAWYYLSTGDRLRPQRVSELPAALLPAKPPPARTAPAPNAPPAASAAHPAAVSPAAAAKPAVTASTLVTPAVIPPTAKPPPLHPPQVVPPAVPHPAVATPASAVLPAESAQKTPPAQPGTAASRVVIRATADSWIAVHDAAGAMLFTRILKQGDNYQVPDEPGITMDTGNAGGLALSLDGKPLPSLGGEGAVRRHIALDPQALLSEKAKAD
jgi:cytoskeleton protein RodZ